MKMIGFGWKRIVGVVIIVLGTMLVVSVVNRQREAKGLAPILR